jgi:hypothetical protein
MMSAEPMESAMRYRHLLLLAGLSCANAFAQSAAPAPSSDHWSKLSPASAATTSGGYRDTLSGAASDAQRFNFNQGSAKDKAPADQSPIRVIINNGRGPNVNCVPMGPGGACH